MAKVEKDINVSEIIKRRKYKLAVKRGYIELLMKLIFFMILKIITLFLIYRYMLHRVTIL